MLEKTMTLKKMLETKITEEDLLTIDEDAHGIVKLIVSATMQEKAYDFLHILTDPGRYDYTMNLFEKITTTPWYDFEQPESKRFVLIWQLETVADEEEIIEYFSECMQLFVQDFGDIIVEYVAKENPLETIKIYTHDNAIHTAKSSDSIKH